MNRVINKFNICLLVGTITILASFPACHKYPDPAQIFETEGGDTSYNRTRKILIIGIDGFSGVDLQNAKPPFLTDSVLLHSKYTYSLFSEQENNDVSAWKSFLSGTDYDTHQTTDSSFFAPMDADDPDDGVANPTSIFGYMMTYKPTLKSVFISSWQSLLQVEGAAADHSILTNNDEQVKDSAISYLSNTTSDMSVVEFNSVAVAGEHGGFSMNNADFTKAISNVDSYIKSMFAAIKARKSYSTENWLIQIVSNKGPDGANPNNGFLLAYNDGLIKEQVHSNGDMVLGLPTTSASAAAPSATTADYDITATNEMTISFKLYVSAYGTLNPGIILKTTSSANSNQGWWFCHNGANGSIRFVLHGTGSVHGSTNNTITSTTGYQGTGEWHSYTGKVYFSGGKRYMQLYIDGQPSASAPIEVTGLNCASVTPLRIGQAGSYYSGTTNQSITDVRIYNVAIPDDVIAANACKAYLDSANDPYYSNLIADWPASAGLGNKVFNQASGESDNYLSLSKTAWNAIPLTGNNICYNSPNPYDPNLIYSIIPQNADVSANALFWLKFDPTQFSSWGIDGGYWISNFDNQYGSTH